MKLYDTAILVVLISAAPCFAFAQDGFVVVRLADPAKNRCIDPKSDRVWVTLRRVITNKSSGWIREDKSVALVINATVKPENGSPISFPLLTESTLSGYSKGQVSIPIEYTIVDGLRLTQANASFSSLSLEMTLLNKQGKNKWGNALVALGEVTKKLPIPSNPYSQTASYLLEFTNNAISKDLQAQSDQDKAQSGALALNFDPIGKCGSGAQEDTDFERTGTIAVVHQTQGPTRDGMINVPIEKSNEYCWRAELNPAFVIKAVRKEPTKICTNAEYTYQQISNNYVGFFINAQTTTGELGADKTDKEESVKRCFAHGLSIDTCFPSK